jgi:hypothetical protein
MTNELIHLDFLEFASVATLTAWAAGEARQVVGDGSSPKAKPKVIREDCRNRSLDIRHE